MNLGKTLFSITMLAALALAFPNSARASAHTEAPLLAFEAVEFGGSRPLFDANGALLAVDRVHFTAVTADGTEYTGSGDLTLAGQDPGNNETSVIGTLDNISGFTGELTDGTSKTFAGMAHVALHSISADPERFAAVGDLWLEPRQTENLAVREFDIEVDLLQGSDGRWRARFHGEDSEGARIDGQFVPVDARAAWHDPDRLHLLGEVEALEFLPAEGDANAFEDKAGAEEMYYAYYAPGSLKGEAAYWRMADGQMPPPSASDEGRFTATLVLPYSETRSNHQHGSTSLRVDEVIVTQSVLAPDGSVAGRAQFLFNGVGSRDGVAVNISGTAEFDFVGESTDGTDWFTAAEALGVNGGIEYQDGDDLVLPFIVSGYQGDTAEGVDWFTSTGGSHTPAAKYQDGTDFFIVSTSEFGFQGDAIEGVDWFMSSGSLRILSGTLEDTATGGAELFEDISGDLGQATLVGGINPLGQVNLAGALGQVVLEP